jgi:two-component system, NtrC family, response regulator HydG
MTETHTKGRILVVDDSADTRELLQRNLSAQGYEIRSAANVPEALRVLDSAPVDLVVTDLKMPGASGLDLVKHIRENLRETEVMMITGYPSLEGAVAAVKLGAEEYLPKPFTREELIAAVTRTMEKHGVKKAGSSPVQWQAASGLGIIGESEAMQAVFKAVSRAAAAMTPVLIVGESGTGKEMVARAIHYASAQSRTPFLSINCVDNPEESLDELLFGYSPDSPSGNVESQAGLWKLIRRGTLYFDEISGLPSRIQNRIMQAIEEEKAAGADPGDSRGCGPLIIGSTCKDLGLLARTGAFREELLFYLSANTIPVPALRERGNDILLLARHFLTKYSSEVGRMVPRYSDHALEVIKAYTWPGNVGELRNFVLSLLAGAQSEVIDAPDFPAPMRSSVAGIASLHRSLAEMEAEHIRDVFLSVGGNKTQASEILGITRKTLREKLKQDDLHKAANQ